MERRKNFKKYLWFLISMILLFSLTQMISAQTSDAVRIISQKSDAKAGRYTIYWQKVKAAEGYEISMYNMANKRLIHQHLTAEKPSYTLSGVKEGQRYRVRIRSYHYKVNPYTDIRKKVYGTYTTTYIGQQPRLKFAWKNQKSAIVTWKALDGASSYTVYLSARRGSGYRKVKTVKTNSVTLKKLGTETTYYAYVVANYKVKKKTYHTPSTYSYPFRLQLTK